ncbi:Nicotinamide/nicotinic acid mononucleotide adenylyltransferase 2 [Vulpes lagopus]
MTETTKTHVILLACGSFNPITKGHIQMFGESSRPPPEAASASPSRHLCFPGRLNCKACAAWRDAPAGASGGRSAPLGRAPGRAQAALPGRPRLRPDPAHRGPPGGGGDGPEGTVGLGRAGAWGAGPGARWYRSLDTWPVRVGVG